MEEPEVLVYISDYNKECERVIQNLKKWKIPYEIKNINDINHMKELQDKGIYGTPAIFIKGVKEPILGFQKNKIKYSLGLLDNHISYYSSFFDGYKNDSK
ncbi:glutaredoxin family protein [Virgibacillus proomii]|jgi:glutaredoxin-like protein NrdH|uniref:glutaredoxin family protein n=1 Tax=Virgibacillus proomii TaxID=84407 RepID=UPI0009848686|nr:glutaredoxin domain-containing protein [Virgibacillus proomii]